METRDLGDHFYWHWAWYPDRKHPRLDMTVTHEIDPPYRIGTAVVWRLPLMRRALVIGYWSMRHENEEDAILAATGGRVVREASVLGHGEDPITGDSK